MTVLIQRFSGFWHSLICLLAAALGLCCLVVGSPLATGASWSPETPSRQGDVDYLTQERRSGIVYSDRLREGWEKYHHTEFVAAAAIFESVIEAPDAAEADVVQAHYGAAMSFSFQVPFADTENARRHFLTLVDDYAEYPAAAWALLELARMESYSSDEGRIRIRAYLQRMFEHYPESIAVHEAAIRLASSYFYETNPELTAHGVAILEDHLELHPENPLASIMHFRLGYWYTEAMHAHDRALPHSLRLGHLRMADPFRWSRHFWHIAQLFRLKFNDPESAWFWLEMIVEEAPQSEHTYTARMLLREREGGASDE